MDGVIGLIVLAVVFIGGYFAFTKLEKFRLREKTAEVTIDSMESRGDVYMIGYRTAEGKIIAVRVPQGEYERSRVGDEGTLTWIRDSFVEFESEDLQRKFR